MIDQAIVGVLIIVIFLLIIYWILKSFYNLCCVCETVVYNYDEINTKLKDNKHFEEYINQTQVRHSTAERKRLEENIWLKSFELIERYNYRYIELKTTYLNLYNSSINGFIDWSKIYQNIGCDDYIGAIKQTSTLLKKIQNYYKNELLSLVTKLIKLRKDELNPGTFSYHGHLRVIDAWEKFKDDLIC